jgi:hypothetical protein
MSTTFRTALVSTAVLVAFLLAGVTYAAEAPKGPVTIKAEGAKMAPVTFSHEKHSKVDCAKCHHKDKDNPKACKSCHDLKEVKDKAPKIQDAFHNTCLKCHKEQKEGSKAPTKCAECHKK